MEQYFLGIFYGLVILAGGFFVTAKLTGHVAFQFFAKIGGIYIVVFAILKIMKVI